jgi:hypothetical protein
MTRLRVKNWAEFQHYRHRRPPWIKLHHGLLDDFAWHRLPEAVTWGFPEFSPRCRSTIELAEFSN